MDRIWSILKRNWKLKLVSLFFACLVWFYVMGEVNPMREKTMQSVPVTVANSQVLDAHSLMVTNDEEWNRQIADLRVSVSVPRSQYESVAADSVKATLDLSIVQAPGSYDIPVDVSVPTNVQLSSVTPSEVTLEVDEISTLEIPVVAETVGTLPSGYYAAPPALSANTVELTGAKSDLARIAQASCSIDLSGLTSSINVAKTVTLLDENGQAVEDAKLRVAVPSVIVQMQVLPTKELPLDQESLFTGQLPAGLALSDVTCTPSTLRVAAPEEVLQALTQVTAQQPIDLSEMAAGAWTRQITVAFPEGVTNADNVEQITVRLVVSEESASAPPAATTTAR